MQQAVVSQLEDVRSSVQKKQNKKKTQLKTETSLSIYAFISFMCNDILTYQSVSTNIANLNNKKTYEKKTRSPFFAAKALFFYAHLLHRKVNDFLLI